jgi:hypothetical protein
VKSNHPAAGAGRGPMGVYYGRSYAMGRALTAWLALAAALVTGAATRAGASPQRAQQQPQDSPVGSEPGTYLVGIGKADITGPIAEVNPMVSPWPLPSPPPRAPPPARSTASVPPGQGRARLLRRMAELRPSPRRH